MEDPRDRARRNPRPIRAQTLDQLPLLSVPQNTHRHLLPTPPPAPRQPHLCKQIRHRCTKVIPSAPILLTVLLATLKFNQTKSLRQYSIRLAQTAFMRHRLSLLQDFTGPSFQIPRVLSTLLRQTVQTGTRPHSLVRRKLLPPCILTESMFTTRIPT